MVEDFFSIRYRKGKRLRFAKAAVRSIAIAAGLARREESRTRIRLPSSLKAFQPALISAYTNAFPGKAVPRKAVPGVASNLHRLLGGGIEILRIVYRPEDGTRLVEAKLSTRKPILALSEGFWLRSARRTVDGFIRISAPTRSKEFIRLSERLRAAFGVAREGGKRRKDTRRL